MTKNAKLEKAVNRHKGQWIAVDSAGKKVIGYGKTVSEAASMAKTHHVPNAIVTKVPTKNIDTYFFWAK